MSRRQLSTVLCLLVSGVLALAGCVGHLTAAQTKGTDPVTARALILVSPDGSKELARLDSVPRVVTSTGKTEYFPQLSLLDDRGKTRAYLGLYDAGTLGSGKPMLDFYAADTYVRTRMQLSGMNDAPAITLYDVNQSARAQVGLSGAALDTPYVRLCGPGTAIRLLGPDATQKCQIYIDSTDNMPKVLLGQDAKKDPIFHVDTSGPEPKLVVKIGDKTFTFSPDKARP